MQKNKSVHADDTGRTDFHGSSKDIFKKDSEIILIRVYPFKSASSVFRLFLVPAMPA